MKRSLGLFSIVMINIIAVDSLRSLAFSAEYGFSLVFFYLLAALTFLIPSGFAAAELASTWPQKGGLYIWIREAFGKKMGFTIIYLQWMYNLFWYPTIVSFIAAALAYSIDPALAENPRFMFFIIQLLFWSITGLNYRGIAPSSKLSTFGALAGTLFPMLCILLLAAFWLISGRSSAISFSLNSFFPSDIDFQNISFYITLLFGLMGLEMSAVHADEVQNPEKIYPRAILLSSLIIIFSLIFSSLAIAIVIPQKDLSFVSGIFQAFTALLTPFSLTWLTPFFALCIAVGSLANMSAWVLGPSKGLMVAFQDSFPKNKLGTESKMGSPKQILFIQAALVTLLSGSFLYFESVSTSYWILSAISAELALFVYIALFSALIWLRIKNSDIRRYYSIPGGKYGAFLVGALGITSCSIGCILGLIKPPSIALEGALTYPLLIGVGSLVILFIPALVFSIRPVNK